MSRTAPDFVEELRKWHQLVKVGRLPPELRPAYERARTELGRLLLVAQNMTQQGPTLRSALRIAQAIKVELDYGGGSVERSMTIDLAEGGFAVLGTRSVRPGQVVHFVLHLPPLRSAGDEPLSGSARVASARPHGGLARVSYAFQDLSPSGREHLAMVIIDAVLARFPTK